MSKERSFSDPPEEEAKNQAPAEQISNYHHPVDSTSGASLPVSFVASSPGSPDSPVRPFPADSLRENLRWIAHRCELNAVGFRVIYPNTTQREILWSDVEMLIVRQLPQVKPWDGKLLMDLVCQDGGKPVRLVSTTFVNFTFLPQGALHSARENFRNLAAYIADRNPRVAFDAETVAFFRSNRPAARFATLQQFAAYDAQF